MVVVFYEDQNKYNAFYETSASHKNHIHVRKVKSNYERLKKGVCHIQQMLSINIETNYRVVIFGHEHY